MANEIGIIGGGEHMGLAIAAIKDAHPNIVIVDADDVKRHRDTFELNGVEYTPIERKTAQTKDATRTSMLMLGMGLMMSMVNGYETRHDRKLNENINIIKEYGLIQQKKSKLSRWERDAVVSIFERNFKKLTE